MSGDDLNRVFLVHDVHGERRLSERDFPLAMGGSNTDIVLPDLPDGSIVAYLALAEGHVYLQPAAPNLPLYHNHERLSASVWLKSGDVVEMGDGLLNWIIQGDRILVDVVQRQTANGSRLVPPASAPQNPITEANKLPDRPAATDKRHTRVYLVYGLLGMLIVIALFVFQATSVRISIEPEPEAMQLSGFPPAVPAGDRYLMWSGQYLLKAQRRGFYPLQEKIKLTDQGFEEYAFALQPLPGHLLIEPMPAVAFELYVDGAEVTPDAAGRFLVERGKHILRVQTARYLPVEEEVDVVGFGREQRMVYPLQPAWAKIRIESDPVGASVQVDGQLLGETPLDAELLAGLRILQLSLPGYQTASLQQQITAGAELTLDRILLQPAAGQLVISTEPADSTVSIDGVYQGRTPITLALTSGDEHRISITRAGYAPVKKQLKLEPEEQRSLTIRLSPEYGTVFLTSQPADAELLIDGKPSGAATRRLRLTARSHTLEVRKPGYISQQVTLTPRAGVSQSVQVTLVSAAYAASSKPQAGSGQGIPDKITAPGGYTLKLIRPRGEFTMGASRREPGRRANESRRKIAMTRPFYLGVQEVSNAQFRLYRAAHDSGQVDGAALDGDDQPVVNVAWGDAAGFCNWLSAQAGLPLAYQENAGKLTLKMPPNTGYRLPTEAEWAYAARAYQRSQSVRYAWSGSYPPTTQAGNYADARIADTLADVVPGYDDGYRGTAPPGSYPASPTGWYDLSGNVAEWINDHYTVYPTASETGVTDPLGPPSGQHHVVRGSSWRHGNITELRLSFRDYSSKPRSDLGFRIARYAE